jgi:hypothetical protein
LSTDQARRVFPLSEVVPDRFTQAEKHLVEIVEGLSVSDTYRTVEYWRQSVAGPDDLRVGGEKPHIMVLTDLDALAGIPGGVHETLNSGDILDVEIIRMLACDLSTRPVRQFWRHPSRQARHLQPVGDTGVGAITQTPARTRSRLKTLRSPR